jgi:hypothetical protein
MPVIRIVLLLIVVGGLALFAFSNLSPVLPLVFLGMPTAPLPLATWIGIAIASGALTSFCLQFLQLLQKSPSTRSFAEVDEVPPQATPFRRESYDEPVYSRPTATPPPPETPKTSAASDWEEPNAKNWEFEQQAKASKTPEVRDQINDATEPKNSPPSGTYSYSYREQDKKQAGVGKADAIYDANYRVIKPPNPTVKPDDDDEDWGFEDDDDFNDESKNTKPRR